MSAIRTTGRKLGVSLLILGLTALSACGRGGAGSAGGASGSAIPASSTLTPQIVKGPIAGPTVKLFFVAATVRERCSPHPDQPSGSFTFSAPQTTGSVSMIEATGGICTDESLPVRRAAPIRRCGQCSSR